MTHPYLLPLLAQFTQHADPAQAAQGARRARQQVADPGDIDDDEVVVQGVDVAGQLADHGRTPMAASVRRGPLVTP